MCEFFRDCFCGLGLGLGLEGASLGLGLETSGLGLGLETLVLTTRLVLVMPTYARQYRRQRTVTRRLHNFCINKNKMVA